MSVPQDKGSRRHGARAESWLGRHACQGGRLSWSARPGSSGVALTRRARSGAATCPGRSGSQPCCLMSEGSYPHGLMDRIGPGPGNLLGFLLYESGPSGAPGLHPRQRPPEWLCDFCNRGATRLGLDDPWRRCPIRLPVFPAFGVRQCWRDGIVPVLMAGRGAGTVESRGWSSHLVATPWMPRFPLLLRTASHWWVVR